MADSRPRVARFDATRVVTRLAELHDVHLTVEGPCPGGEGGACYVRWPDGHRSVLSSAYWAHISLREVDWSIRHHDAETVDRWLTVAESGLD